MTPLQRRALLALFTAGAAWAAFVPILGNGFVNWDDPGNITRNIWLGRFDPTALRWAWVTPHFGHFQPLAWFSLSLDRIVWGLEPAGYHLTALALHAAAAAALFALLRAFLRATEPAQADWTWHDLSAAAAAVIWAVHPLRTEAVAWATERRELLAALFVFLSSRSYLLAVEKDRDSPALGASLAWFGAACLSKVTVTPLPFAFLALDRWVLSRPFKAREKSLFWLLSAATLALGIRAQILSGTATPLAKFGVADRLAQAFYAPGFYSLKTLVPTDLSAFVFVDWRLEAASFWPMVVLGLAVLAVLATASRLRPGARALSAILFLALAPSLGFFKSGPQTVADRFVHIASAALAAALAWGLTRVPRERRTLALASAGLAALALAAASRRQCLVWRDPVSLWSHAISAGHRTQLETLNLAAALRVAGRETEASALYEDLRNSRPDSSAAAVMAGDESYSAGDYRTAAASYARALEIDPGLWGVRVNLGLALYRLGRRAEAETAFLDTVRMDPLNSDAWHNLGVCYAGRGLAMQAEHAFKEALRISPERADTRAALVKLDRLTHPRRIIQINAR